MNKTIHWLALALAFIAGCATPPSKVSVLPTDAQTLSTLKPNEGIVIIRLADATPMTRYPANYITFAPQDVNAKLENTYKRVKSLDDARRSSSTFVAVLPANEYSIESFNQFYNFGQYYIQQFYPADVGLGTFKVEPGKITNLGVVALTIRGTDEKYQYRVVRAGKLDLADKILKDNYPALVSFVADTQDQLTWHEDDFDEDHQLFYSQAVQNPLTFNSITENTDKTSTLTARLGTLLHRQGEGDWRIEAIDADFDIFSYTKSHGGDEIIAAEYNTLLMRNQGSDQWKPIAAPASGGMLYFAYFGPKNTLYAGSMTKQGAVIFRADDFKSPAWVPIVVVTNSGGITKPLGDMYKKDFLGYDGLFFEKTIATDSYLLLTMGNNIFRFDFSGEKVTPLLQKKSILDMNFNNGVTSVVTDGFINNPLHVSDDGGKTWKNIDWPSIPGTGEGTDTQLKSLSAPLFVDKNLGYAFQKGTDKDSPPQFVKTIDGGKTWQYVNTESLPKGCYDLLQLTEGDAISAQCALSGEFYLSSDRGHSWVVDKERVAN